MFMKKFEKLLKQKVESFEKLLKQEIFERFYKLLSKQAIKVSETFKVKQSKERNISGNIMKKEVLQFLDVFRKNKTFSKSIHSLSSFSSLFSVLKTIFQVQVRQTFEHNRSPLTSV